MKKAMLKSQAILIAGIVFCMSPISAFLASATAAPATLRPTNPPQVLLIPALVLGLRHNVNQEFGPSGYMVFFSAPANCPVQRLHGGDLGAPLHRGYDWWMIRDDPNSNPASWKLPPGIVLGLKHSLNQPSAGITVFGHDPSSGPDSLPGFQRQEGADLAAPSGHGYQWYESTGEGFSDWIILDRLPRWTVVGLKHNGNQPNKHFVWQGQYYDPADPTIAPPPGFVRKEGGDLGAPAGQGYSWYEKITGPEIVVKPSLTVSLDRSLILGPTDDPNFYEDLDHDCLIDYLEDTLANVLRPYFIFDSDESARAPHEPITLFQVRPLDLNNQSNLRILIKWLFLFRQDGGYGPDASVFCATDRHEGDNDDGFFELESRDRGVTWTLIRVSLSRRGGRTLPHSIDWPNYHRLEVYDVTHPIVYMSASKHHMYTTRDYDHDDSFFSDVPLVDDCNEDVNGLGDRMLADLQSVSSNPGHLEVVAREGDRLVCYWRMDRLPLEWKGPIEIAQGVSGTPAMIQSNFSQPGQFEVVVPLAAGGLAHFWRNNDAHDPSWQGPIIFGGGRCQAVSLIQSNFTSTGAQGNLEVVARERNRLVYFWREDGPPFTWHGPFDIPGSLGVTGNPALIQSDFGQRSDFIVVVPSIQGGLVYFRRENDHPSLPWRGPILFGSGQVEAVSLIQSTFTVGGNKGNMEAVAQEGNRLVAYWREDRPPWTWHGPFDIPGSLGVIGNPSLIQSEFGSNGNFELVVPLAEGGLAHFARFNDLLLQPWFGPFPFGSGPVAADSLIQSSLSSFYNNVGEPDRANHPSPPFVNNLSRYYPGHSAWGSRDFYQVGPIRDKWMTQAFNCDR